jgi:hypothetical protein
VDATKLIPVIIGNPVESEPIKEKT